ncbi:cyclin-like protein [Zalerion maritima]|uniref:Cyclin-like protein n=1 Tax=Zalerion maritima TaxID=339359 RepID=A0AAD5RTH7_9PEZI|nr:cyclin-like protein [Zalerion maritima]
MLELYFHIQGTSSPPNNIQQILQVPPDSSTALSAMPSSSLATEDARYRASSQHRLWSMSTSALAAKRRENNATAREQISSRRQQIWEYENKPLAQRTLDFLTPEDELKLVNFNTNELLRAGAHLEFPIEVLATGAILFRRFYVTNSIMTYPPTQILKTALFFAAKVELGFDKVARRFEQLPKTSVEEVIAGEYVLAMANKFAYDVRHPFRALEGAILELRRLGGPDITEKKLNHVRRKTRDLLKFSPLITDAYFHYTPSQIMLAALSIIDRELSERLLNSLFQPPSNEDAPSGTSTPLSGGSTPLPVAAFAAQMRDRVMGTIEACREMLKTQPLEHGHYWHTGPGSAETKPLRRKLKSCHDPDRWDLLRLQRMRREQPAKVAGEKDKAGGEDDPFGEAGPEAKRRKVKKEEEEDPFGPALG